MRPAFPCFLVQAPAADHHRQALHDAPGHPPAPAATTMERNAMPPAPLAVNAVTCTPQQAAAPGTRAPAREAPGHDPRKARALLTRRAQTAPAAAASSDTTGSARTANGGDRLRRVAGLLRRTPTTGCSFYDPLSGRPDLVEDDYYRFRHQSRGW